MASATETTSYRFKYDQMVKYEIWKNPEGEEEFKDKLYITLPLIFWKSPLVLPNDNKDLEPIHEAAKSGNVEMLEILKESGAYYNAESRDKWTPLHLACSYGQLNAVNFLIKNGAYNSGETTDGITPLHLAVNNGHTEVVQALVSAGVFNTPETKLEKWTPLHLAANNGHIETTKALLKAEPYLSPESDSGWTPLHLAAKNGHYEIAKCLIGYGTYLEGKTADGSTPLSLATKHGHTKIAKLILNPEEALGEGNSGGSMKPGRNGQGLSPQETAVLNLHGNMVGNIMGMYEKESNKMTKNDASSESFGNNTLGTGLPSESNMLKMMGIGAANFGAAQNIFGNLNKF